MVRRRVLSVPLIVSVTEYPSMRRRHVVGPRRQRTAIRRRHGLELRGFSIRREQEVRLSSFAACFVLYSNTSRNGMAGLCAS